jgi:cytidyltransferase-like protein
MTYKKVLTVGVYDIFHIGHLNVLEAAKKLGNFLIVGVHDDKLNIKQVEFLYSIEERIRFVSSLKFVDEVVNYERVDLFVKEIDFDIFVHGPDQNHKYFQKAFEWCRTKGIEIIEIERTEGISSEKLINILKNKSI